MAKPIKETPVLTGEDAERFFRAAKENEQNYTDRISKQDYEKAQEAYEKILKNKTF